MRPPRSNGQRSDRRQMIKKTATSKVVVVLDCAGTKRMHDWRGASAWGHTGCLHQSGSGMGVAPVDRHRPEAHSCIASGIHGGELRFVPVCPSLKAKNLR